MTQLSSTQVATHIYIHVASNLQSHHFLDHHQVNEQHCEYNEEGNVEDGVLDERSDDLLPDTEVTGQHVGLSQRQHQPTNTLTIHN